MLDWPVTLAPEVRGFGEGLPRGQDVLASFFSNWHDGPRDIRAGTQAHVCKKRVKERERQTDTD